LFDNNNNNNNNNNNKQANKQINNNKNAITTTLETTVCINHVMTTVNSSLVTVHYGYEVQLCRYRLLVAAEIEVAF